MGVASITLWVAGTLTFAIGVVLFRKRSVPRWWRRLTLAYVVPGCAVVFAIAIRRYSLLQVLGGIVLFVGVCLVGSVWRYELRRAFSDRSKDDE